MMKQNKMEEQWLDEIRQSLADHEEELPADGWEKLAAVMASVEEVPSAVPDQQPKSPSIMMMWLKRVAAAILVGAIGVGGMYYFSDSPETLTPSSASTVEESATEVTPAIQKESSTEKPLFTQTDLSTKKKILAKVSASEQIKELVLEQEVEKEETKKPKIQEKNAVPESQPSEPSPLSDIHQEENSVLLAMEETPVRKLSASRSWVIGMRLGRNGSSDFDFEDSWNDESPGHMVGSPSPSDSTQEKSTTRALPRAAHGRGYDDIVSIENCTSWSAGISVGKQLNRFLSFESGLVYTYLSSDVTKLNTGRQHQQLHYLGIPLKLNAAIAEEGRWRFYATIGTMLEHSLYGKYGTTNLHLNDWQWSMDGGLGLQYKLTDYMGLYVEPGVNYYFSNGSDVPSIRTESPFSFNLQIGVRFGL